MPDEVVGVVEVAGAEGVEAIVALVWIWIDVVSQIRGLSVLLVFFRGIHTGTDFPI